MNPRRLLRASLLLNGILLVALAVVFPAGPRKVASATTSPENIPTHGAAVQGGEPEVGEPAGSVTSLNWKWDLLPMESLTAYRDGLRAIGCPDSTIREIVSPIVFRRFREQARSEMAPWSRSFWERLSAAPQKSVEEVGAIVSRLREQASQALGELVSGLSDDAPAETTETPAETAEADSIAEFLPPGLRAEAREASRRNAERLRAWYWSRERWVNNRSVGATEITDRFKEELAAILPADQAAEYYRRDSGYAAFRFQQSMSLSEAELASIVDLYDRTEENPDPSVRKEGLKRLLGEDRAVEFERSQNDEFQWIDSLGRSEGVPSARINAFWEERQAVESAERELRSTPGLSRAERRRKLAELQARLVASADSLLGSSGSVRWQKLQANWLDEHFQLMPAADPWTGTPKLADP